ncbi:MAG TPA: Kdo hydroxylase family protein [Caulobacteraceae bacterium]
MSHDGLRRLETDGIIVLPDRPFVLSDAESGLLRAPVSDGRAKNVSLDPSGAVVRGAAGCEEALGALMNRYAGWARALIVEVAPRYAQALQRGRTSFRPRDAREAAASPRKDDRRLHADAFPSQPTGGKRLLRVFSNVNPAGESRLWRIGEPFEAYARRWLSQVRRPWPGEAWALHSLGITRARRTAYDALMLGLHDHAKLDADYQRLSPRRDIALPAGSSWIVFTDSLVHAALAGRFALEQTFYLPITAMEAPAASPLKILERLAGRVLA